MPDREKVAEDLTDIGGWIAGRVGFERAKNFLHTIDEAVALLKEQNSLMLALEQSNAVNEFLNAEVERLNGLLKEQDAVKPIPPTEESDLWRCGNCSHQIFRCKHQRFCEMCGRAVKWE